MFDSFVDLYNNRLITVQITRTNILALICREIAYNGSGLCPKLYVLQTSLKGFKVAALRPFAH